MLSFEFVGKHLSGHPNTDVYKMRRARNIGDTHTSPVFHCSVFGNPNQSLFVQSGAGKERNAMGNRTYLQTTKVGRYLDEFAKLLSKRGYRTQGIKYRLRIIRVFGRWLDGRGLNLRDVDEQTATSFLEYRWKYRSRNGADEPGLRLFLNHLRDRSVVRRRRQRLDQSSLARTLRAYDRYLVRDRGLAKATRENYVSLVRSFLVDKFGKDHLHLRQLNARDVTRFLHRYCQRFSKGRVKLLVTALRSFLRYALVKGLITNDLVSGVPTVAYWKRSGLPKAISQVHIKRILRGCDRRTAIGRRDYGVLLLLTRLGLRCHEVVLMTLDDIDWDQGEITIRGKGCRSDRLPIPGDVGMAIAAYLRRGRPRCLTRRLFVRDRAPYDGFSDSTAVGDILRRAAARAGLDPSGLGPHRLRHSVATEMLRHGATLHEISEILRHRHADTTAIYAKVDLVALRQLAQPWPGVRK